MSMKKRPNNTLRLSSSRPKGNVRLKANFCRNWKKYVQLSSVYGNISLSIAGCVWHLCTITHFTLQPIALTIIKPRRETVNGSVDVAFSTQPVILGFSAQKAGWGKNNLSTLSARISFRVPESTFSAANSFTTKEHPEFCLHFSSSQPGFFYQFLLAWHWIFQKLGHHNQKMHTMKRGSRDTWHQTLFASRPLCQNWERILALIWGAEKRTNPQDSK